VLSEYLLSAAQAGTIVDLAAETDGSDWGPDRQIPADLLLTVLTGAGDRPVHPRGLRIRGARITGEMAWDWQRLAVPLELEDCVIDSPVNLDHAQVAGLTLIRCRLPDLSAAQLISASTLKFLSCAVAGSIILRDAEVSGAVLLSGTTLDGVHDPVARHRTAFLATRMQLTGALVLGNGFRASGAVILSGVRIGGNLFCGGGRFLNPGGETLTVTDADIAGSVVLGTGFESVGIVGFDRMRIGGNFNCDDGHFTATGSEALSAIRIDIGGGFFMRGGFTATGRLRMVGARVRGNWNCTGGTFRTPDGEDAIWATGAQISGDVLFCDGFTVAGRVRLVDAQIGGSLNGEGAGFVHPGGRALEAVNLTVSGDLALGGGTEAVGEVCLSGARIGGSVSCDGGSFTTEDGVALSLSGADVEGNVRIGGGFRARGEVQLAGARVGGNLACGGGEFSNPGGTALAADGMTVVGSFRWRMITGPLLGRLDLRRARVGELDDDVASWPAPGCLRIAGFGYDRLSDRAPRSPHSRVEWIRRQRGYTPEPYQQLAAVYRSSGQISEATTVAMAQQDDLLARGELNRPARAWNRFLGRSIGHGYRPGRAAWTLLALYAVTLVSVWLGVRADAFIQTGNTAPQPSVTASHCGDAYPCLSAPAYALENITPILNLHQSENWHPKSSTPAEALLRDWLYLSTVVGYAGTTLLAAALSGLARSTAPG
jgi:hypothetical protein